MSSTVGYGIEITKINNDFDIWEDEQLAADLGLEIKTSRAEYGDEERMFLIDKNSMLTAGVQNNTATVLRFDLPAGLEEIFAEFFSSAKSVKNISPLSWWLIDYYVYS